MDNNPICSRCNGILKESKFKARHPLIDEERYHVEFAKTFSCDSCERIYSKYYKLSWPIPQEELPTEVDMEESKLVLLTFPKGQDTEDLNKKNETNEVIKHIPAGTVVAEKKHLVLIKGGKGEWLDETS